MNTLDIKTELFDNDDMTTSHHEDFDFVIIPQSTEDIRSDNECTAKNDFQGKKDLYNLILILNYKNI